MLPAPGAPKERSGFQRRHYRLLQKKSSGSVQEETWNRMQKKEEKEEPSGKTNSMYQQKIPSQASSPHHTGLSCESCLWDGQSSALPESHTGMSLSTLSATVRFWVQISWFEPEMQTIEWWTELKHVYSLKPLTVCVTGRGARFSKKAFVLHLQNLHTCIQSVVHKYYILACKMYQNSGACTTACFTCRFKYSAHAIGLFMIGRTFYWCNFYTFFKNIWLFADLNHLFFPFVLTTLLYFHLSLKNCMEFLDHQRGFLLLCFLALWKNCLVTSGRCTMKKKMNRTAALL